MATSVPDLFIQIDHRWYQTIGFSSRDNAWSSLLSVRTTSHCCVWLLQGMTLPSVGGIRFANERRRQGGQQTVRDLAANVWIFLYDATSGSLSNIDNTRTHPLPVLLPNPSPPWRPLQVSSGVVTCTCPSTTPANCSPANCRWTHRFLFLEEPVIPS